MYAYFETAVLTVISLIVLYFMGIRAYSSVRGLLNKNEIESEKKCSCCK